MGPVSLEKRSIYPLIARLVFIPDHQHIAVGKLGDGWLADGRCAGIIRNFEVANDITVSITKIQYDIGSVSIVIVVGNNITAIAQPGNVWGELVAGNPCIGDCFG